jgi:tetratricopeptide (TPR) repeat protein
MRLIVLGLVFSVFFYPLKVYSESLPIGGQIETENPQNIPDELEIITEQIRLNPNNAQAYEARAKVYFQRSEYQKAIEDYNQAIKLDPNNAHTYNYRGTAYYWLEHYQRSLEDYNQAIKLNPDLAIAYYNRGYVYQKLGDKKAALQDFKQGANLSQQQGDLDTYNQALEMIRELEESMNNEQ